MSISNRIDEAAEWARVCISGQIAKARDMFGFEIVNENFDKILYPHNLGYIYGVVGRATERYDIKDDYFVDVFDNMCSKIKIGIFGERLRNKINYMTYENHATQDLFFIAGSKKGREDAEKGFNNDKYRGLLIAISRFYAPHFPRKFNSNPIKLFFADTDMIKNIATVRGMKGKGILERLEKIGTIGKSEEDILQEFEKEIRPEVYLLLLSFRAADINDIMYHKSIKEASVTTSRPTRAKSDMKWSEYAKFAINNLKNKLLYGGKEEITNRIENYIGNNWPANKVSIYKNLFGTKTPNRELSKIYSGAISNLKSERKIRRYNKKRTYVPFGYTMKTGRQARE